MNVKGEKNEDDQSKVNWLFNNPVNYINGSDVTFTLVILHKKERGKIAKTMQ